MELNDVRLIRIRRNKDTPWHYELCSKKEIELHKYIKDNIDLCIDSKDGYYQIFKSTELEIMDDCIHISKDIEEEFYGK